MKNTVEVFAHNRQYFFIGSIVPIHWNFRLTQPKLCNFWGDYIITQVGPLPLCQRADQNLRTTNKTTSRVESNLNLGKRWWEPGSAACGAFVDHKRTKQRKNVCLVMRNTLTIAIFDLLQESYSANFGSAGGKRESVVRVKQIGTNCPKGIYIGRKGSRDIELSCLQLYVNTLLTFNVALWWGNNVPVMINRDLD